MSIAVLLLVGLPILLEICYRVAHGIPLTGGILYAGELRIPESVLAERPWYRTFLETFQPSLSAVLLYEPRPGHLGRFYAPPGSDPGPEISINSQGFRDREFSLEKPADAFRIVVLGDSIVWGHGLPAEATYCKQLERQLTAASGRKCEVLNFGVSGYSTRQEVELYRVRASRFDPDLVLVGYCLNDYDESSVEGQAFRRLYYDIYSHSYLYERLHRGALVFADAYLGLSFEDPRARTDLREQFQLLQSARNERKSVVLVFPELADFGHYPRGHEHRLVFDAIRGLNYAVLDLLPAFARYSPEELRVSPTDCVHPDALGCRVAAEATVALLLENELVPVAKAAADADAAPGDEH